MKLFEVASGDSERAESEPVSSQSCATTADPDSVVLAVSRAQRQLAEVLAHSLEFGATRRPAQARQSCNQEGPRTLRMGSNVGKQ